MAIICIQIFFTALYFLILYVSQINTRRLIDSSIDLISSITPEFEKTDTQATTNQTIIKFQVIENYPHEIKYSLYLSEYNPVTWYKYTAFYKNWLYNNDDYISFYNTETLWLDYNIVYTNISERIVYLNNLKESK